MDGARALTDLICRDLGLPSVDLIIDAPSVEILEEIRAHPDILDFVIEASEDDRYEQSNDGSPVEIVFDAVLTDCGEQVPLQLVLHELSHHVEWHQIGDFSAHGPAFAESLIRVTDRACELLGLRPRPSAGLVAGPEGNKQRYDRADQRTSREVVGMGAVHRRMS